MQQSFDCRIFKLIIHQIEMVQRKAARFVYNDYSRHSSVTDMLNQLNWLSLEKRRDIDTTLGKYSIYGRDDLTLLMF